MLAPLSWPYPVRRYQSLSTAQAQMSDEFDLKLAESYKPALSVLFNQFILAQVSTKPFRLGR
jgi:hypothetical protein